MHVAVKVTLVPEHMVLSESVETIDAEGVMYGALVMVPVTVASEQGDTVPLEVTV